MPDSPTRAAPSKTAGVIPSSNPLGADPTTENASLRTRLKLCYTIFAVLIIKFALLDVFQHVGVITSGGGPVFRFVNQFGPRRSILYEPAVTITAPKLNVWAPITSDDNVAVWNWLHDPARGLNLTEPGEAEIGDNKVYSIDTLPLNKSDVVLFLDGIGPRPKPWARVMIFEGGKDEPVAQEYMVGPLPVSDDTDIVPLDYIYNGGMGGAVPYNARPMDPIRSTAIGKLVGYHMGAIADITSDLFQGAAYYGPGDERSTIDTDFPTPFSYNGSEAHVNVAFHFPGTAHYLLPIDFYTLVDASAIDYEEWRLRGFVTKERFFATADELRDAYEAGELEQEFEQHQDYDWARVKYQPELGERPLESRPAPQSLEVGGKRYMLDPDQSKNLGLMFYDVRFKGESILYELSMQEAASQYGGFQPKAGSTVFQDTSFSMGAAASPLIEGFDCPFGSTFWNISHFATNRTFTIPRALCIFEHDSGHPLSRHDAGEHNGWGFESLGVVKSSALSLRYIATIGNYDYIFTYDFAQDGAIHISVRASGYLQSSPYYKDQGRFGPRIQRATQGSIHDHVMTFKADFDLVDSNNSLEKTELKVVEQEQPWFPEVGIFEQIQLEKSLFDREQQFNWGANDQTMYSVINSNKTNVWGEKRGYRIAPGMSDIRLSTTNSPWSRHNTAFMKSNLAVTRQHDTEQFANSIYNAHLPGRPHHDFAKFFDDETVDGEDLVVWFNLGMHHFTRAEDIPVTLFTEAVSSISLVPQNFFDRAQDGDLKNRRWYLPDTESDTLDTEDYGVELPSLNFRLEEPEVPRLQVSE
ncbi:primary-amine oxidase [Geosmithia morbida]|uniref:Amine oxidase n=1 Tax=Geosmithia morbida TaxID=1094350 RepID=A0A9P4YYV2_9HYPO|nr:primary-amine oxidase [Geosmithia morbida]KAF4124299.1 primary-amine oxidase [Geosmithia morbida]